MIRGIIEAVGSLLPVESYIAARSRRLKTTVAEAQRAHDFATDPDRSFGIDLVEEGRTEDTIFFAQVELARLVRMAKALEATFPK